MAGGEYENEEAVSTADGKMFTAYRALGSSGAVVVDDTTLAPAAEGRLSNDAAISNAVHGLVIDGLSTATSVSRQVQPLKKLYSRLDQMSSPRYRIPNTQTWWILMELIFCRRTPSYRAQLYIHE